MGPELTEGARAEDGTARPATVAPPPLVPTGTQATGRAPHGAVRPAIAGATLAAEPAAELSGQASTAGWRWVLRPLAIYAVSRAATWLTLGVCALATGQSLGQVIDRWDSKWFLKAATVGWPTSLPYRNGHIDGNTTAFFPAFPVAIRWLSRLTGMPELVAGVVVVVVSGITATIGVWLLVRHFAGSRSADRATLLVAVFPGSFILSLVYAEGMVITFVAFGLLALLTRRWVLAGVLGLLATATSPIALAFEVSCLWCAYRAIARDRDWRSLVAPVLAPVGFVVYQAWLWGHTGNLLAWRLTERQGWNSYPSLVFPFHTLTKVVRDPVAANVTDDLLFAGIVLTVVLAVVAVRQRLPAAVLCYGLAAAGLALVSAPVGLRPRFIFLAFPLVAALGIRLRGRAYAAAAVVSVVGLMALTAYEVSSFAVFP